MKLISLNTWGGRAGKDVLLDFFKRHADVDIFCLQEVWNGGEHMLKETGGGVKLEGATPQLLSEIRAVLTEHTCYFRPHLSDFYGLALFARNTLSIQEEGEIFVYKERGYVSEIDFGNHARNIQYLTIDTAKGPQTIINFHGLWNGGGKFDSDDRLLQSDNIVSFLRTRHWAHILCGDFNLLPETQSLKKFEEAGLRNLIAEYGVTSTRSHHYTKEHRYADYAFVTKDVEIVDFRVLDEPVSDHLPLYLEWR